MKTTADYMDNLRRKLGVDSDFKAMNALGVKHRQQVSQWRQLHGGFGEELCIRVANTRGAAWPHAGTDHGLDDA